jgi:uncharacterized protein (TIGR03437 family)
VDPGERVTMNFTLRNSGSADTPPLVAALLASGGVNEPSGPQAYGVLRAGGPAVSRSFSFSAAQQPLGSTITATLRFQEGNQVSVPLTLGVLKLTNEPGQCSANLRLASPNNCGPVQCTAATGPPYPAGAHLLSCATVEGARFNFRLEVRDAQTPAITCPANIVATAPQNQCSAPLNPGAVRFSDNCPTGLTLKSTRSDGQPLEARFPLGFTNVTAEATDAAGNKAACRYTVAVKPNLTAQPLACPANITTEAASINGRVVTYATPEAADSCFRVAVNCTPRSGTLFPVGATTVNCTATNALEQTSFCRFVVNVRGLASNVSAASFRGGELAAESIVAAFGVNLAEETRVATELPLPTALAGTRVEIEDRAGVKGLAGLFFVSPAQINFLLPAGLAAGAATVLITNRSGAVSSERVQLAAVAPGLFAANANGRDVAAGVVLRVRADGGQTFEPLARFDAEQRRFVPIPLDFGPANDRLFLVLFGTGFRYRSQLAAVAAQVGGVATQISYAGAQGGLAGLDQLNIALPRSLAGRGVVNVNVAVEGKAANTVTIAVR